uniref:APC membrane recruitment protein 2 n=1 Tax=Oreochromis aureus TaxID=47969 RepID=A0A668TZ40_OREAU
MDVQTENMDPPPCESQPSGKIRKGFKLFGKRKPGNIFSIRSKGDGNNKSPVHRSKTLDGLSESPAPDSEQEPDKEKGQEVSEAEKEQAEEEPLGEDGVLAAAPARNSVSSASSAKSLSFLSLLRGGRRGVGDRRVHTVSQPVGRQRRGLKGLFGNVKFKSKDKEEKEELPPSPLLMSSRANSVEIIKEDLTLTPKSQPRSLDSPETERREHGKSATTLDSATPSPPETVTSQVTTSSVSKTHENVAPSPTSEPPLVPGDTSLSSLLADISSLLTFDSITGGGDIMADVEAEWGKASSAIISVSTDSPAPISVPKPLSASGQIPVSQPKAHPVPPGAPCPVTSLPPTPKPQPSEAPASAKPSGSGLATVDSQLASPNGTNGEGVQTAPCKTEEPHKESRTSLQEPPREKRTQAKASGLSKIPVVGGSRVGRLPVRDSQQHADEESNRNPPTPVLEEERPHFNSHDAGNKDKISAAEATSKHTQEDSQHPQHQKVLTSSARDSKIPVKHGAQTHTASQVPQTKEPPRTKIPVSKVPVRRAGTKPAATGGSAQMRK